MNLLSIEAVKPRSPFDGKQPPRTLREFYSEVFDRGLLEGFISNARIGEIRQRNVIASNYANLHLRANQTMKKEGIMIDHDDYSGRDSTRQTICRPPFDALHIMSAPWLSRFNHGLVPHVGIFSTKQLLQFKAKGWQHNSCIYFSEYSEVPKSILDGTAWSSNDNSEGRDMLESFARHSNLSISDTSHTLMDIMEDEELTITKTEPTDDRWWIQWKTDKKILKDIVHLFEHGDDSMQWLPAKSWTTIKDRNYYYLCKYYVVIYLNSLDQNLPFVADHLRKVDIFQDARVAKNGKIVQLAKDASFIETLK